MRTRFACLVVVMVAASGCSLILRGEDYVGGNTDADAGDAGPRPDGGDGGPDSGPPGNRAPLASGVGLSDYRPLLGRPLRAFVGPLHDADGDAIQTTLVWRHNDEVLAGEASTTLMLDAARFSVGDRVRVEVLVRDAEGEGDAVWAEARIEGDDTTRWRRILPPRRAATSGAGVFDAVAQRFLFLASTPVEDQSVWEMQITGSGSGRWAQLHPAGAPPDAPEGVLLHDRAGQRLIYFGGMPREGGSPRIWALSLAERGRESWSEVITTGPSARTATSIGYSEAGDRAWAFGGVTESGMLGDLFEVGLRTTAFTQVGPTHLDPKVGVALLHDAARNRLIMLGGGRFPSGSPAMDFPVPTDEIDVLDLANPAAGFQPAGTLPFPLVAGGGFVQGGRGYVVLGIRDPSATGSHTGVLEVDLETLAVTMHPATGSPTGILPVITSRAPFASTVVTWARGVESGSEGAFELAVGTRAFTALGDVYPGTMVQAAGGRTNTGQMLIGGGRRSLRGGPLVDELWRFDGSGAWTGVNMMPSPTHGAPPGGWRAGTGLDPSAPYGDWRIWQVFGEADTGFASYDQVWYTESSRWARLTLSATSAQPARRRGQALMLGACAGPDGTGVVRGNQVGIFGGEEESGALLDDSVMLSCALPGGGTPPTDCRWEPFVVNAPRPSARSWAASATASAIENDRARTAFVFGGRGATGALADVWTVETCGDSVNRSTWGAVSLTGASPSARYGHSASHVPGPEEDGPSTILLFGGGSSENARDMRSDVWRFVPEGLVMGTYRARFDPVTVAGEQPIPRSFHVALWDPSERRLLVYGGAADERLALDDMWELRIRD